MRGRGVNWIDSFPCLHNDHWKHQRQKSFRLGILPSENGFWGIFFFEGDDIWESVWLEDVEKFKGFLNYFKKDFGGWYSIHTISPNVNHTIEVVVTFNKGELFFLAADYCNWPFYFIQLFSVVQGGFTDTWRTTGSYRKLAMTTGVGSPSGVDEHKDEFDHVWRWRPGSSRTIWVDDIFPKNLRRWIDDNASDISDPLFWGAQTRAFYWKSCN